MPDGILVRLLANSSHGSAGDVVYISSAVGRDLIARGEAVAVSA